MLIIAMNRTVIIHDQRHIHVIMNIIVNPMCSLVGADITFSWLYRLAMMVFLFSLFWESMNFMFLCVIGSVDLFASSEVRNSLNSGKK